MHDLVRIEGNIDAEGYIGMLEDYLLPVRVDYVDRHAFLLQHDNARIRTARCTMEYPRSQDIQVIE